MNCPNCGKELELKQRQVGLDDSNAPIYNEFAICKDCKKMWNLDKQRQKKMTASKTTAKPAERSVEKSVDSEAAKAAPKPVAKHPEHAADAPKKKPAHHARPEGTSAEAQPKKHPKKRPADTHADTDENFIGNIPPEHVRKKKETAVRKSYEEMLNTDPRKQQKKKKRPADQNTEEPRQPKRKTQAPKPTPKPAEEPVYDDYDDYEDEAKFRPLRIVLGILSILGGLFFGAKAVLAGLDGISSGGKITTGMVYVILALCILLSGLLTLFMRNVRSRLAFFFPLLFCAGGAGFTFLKHGSDKWLLYGAIASGVLAIIYLILLIAGGRKGDDYEDDYDDPFEDDYADDDY